MNQFHHIQVKQSAQPAMLPKSSLCNFGDSLFAHAGMRNSEIPLCCGLPLTMQGRLLRSELPFLVTDPHDDHQSGYEDERKHDDPNGADDPLKIFSHRGSLISVPKARIDGTHMPTKIPVSLSAKNQR